MSNEQAKNGESYPIHPALREIVTALNSLRLRVFVIGARSLIIHGVDLGRETRDWDLAIDKPFTPELRDGITRLLRNKGFSVQWRKWGFLVEGKSIHVDINYAPLTFDEEFIRRSVEIEPGIYLPCLEDLVILKLMSGERKDLEDSKRILHQAWHRIDKSYLRKRAKQAGLEKELKRLLRRLRLR